MINKNNWACKKDVKNSVKTMPDLNTFQQGHGPSSLDSGAPKFSYVF